MANELQVRVNQISVRAEGENDFADLKGTKRGEVCVIEFFTEMVLEGRGFHSHAGNKSTAITGDEAITTTASEMSVSANSGMAFIPFEVQIAINDQGGNAIEMAGKSVGAIGTAGTLFTALPLKRGGVASRLVVYNKTAGGATVASETALTTRQHFHYSEEFAGADTNAEGVGGILWTPRLYPVLPGASCFYVQVASATTAPGYYGHINWIEMPTVNIT